MNKWYQAQLKQLWLVCRRYGLNKDMRRLLMRLARRVLFDFENNVWRQEAVERAQNVSALYKFRVRRCIWLAIQVHVEQCTEDEPADTRLTKLVVRWHDGRVLFFRWRRTNE